jgi:hypothetical protein
VGGLEERLYPVYCIDVDLSMALRRLGFVVLCQPASRIRHHQGASGNLRFRTFASERNRRLLIEKWGKALEAYEPPARQAAPAIDRATARAQSRWNERLRDGPPAIAPAPARAALDPSQQEFRLAETSRAFQRAYIEHLTKALEDAEEQLKQGEEERSRQDRILRSRSAMVRRLAAMLVFGKPRT